MTSMPQYRRHEALVPGVTGPLFEANRLDQVDLIPEHSPLVNLKLRSNIPPLDLEVAIEFGKALAPCAEAARRLVDVGLNSTIESARFAHALEKLSVSYLARCSDLPPAIPIYLKLSPRIPVTQRMSPAPHQDIDWAAELLRRGASAFVVNGQFCWDPGVVGEARGTIQLNNILFAESPRATPCGLEPLNLSEAGSQSATEMAAAAAKLLTPAIQEWIQDSVPVLQRMTFAYALVSHLACRIRQRPGDPSLLSYLPTLQRIAQQLCTAAAPPRSIEGSRKALYNFACTAMDKAIGAFIQSVAVARGNPLAFRNRRG